jgi:hypothetical protein
MNAFSPDTQKYATVTRNGHQKARTVTARQHPKMKPVTNVETTTGIIGPQPLGLLGIPTINWFEF